MTVSFFFQTLITGISNGMVAYLMVAGVSLIISGMNMVNFGQGAFYVLGTYLTYTIAAKLGFVPALFIVPLIVAGIGYFVEKATRPLFGKNMLYIMLLTYGVAYMVCDMMVMIWGYSIRLLALPSSCRAASRCSASASPSTTCSRSLFPPLLRLLSGS